jgi:hypothetical protein
MVSVMDWQQELALAVVAVTVGLLIWRGWRRARSAGGGGCGCGCPGSGGGRPMAGVIYRARRGERDRIEVKSGRGGRRVASTGRVD